MDKNNMTKDIKSCVKMLLKEYPNSTVIHRIERIEWTHFLLLKPFEEFEDDTYDIVETILMKWYQRGNHGELCIIPASQLNMKRTKHLIRVDEYNNQSFKSDSFIENINTNPFIVKARQKKSTYFILGGLTIAILGLFLWSFFGHQSPSLLVEDDRIEETPIDSIQNLPKQNDSIFAQLELYKNDLKQVQEELEEANDKISRRDEEISLLRDDTNLVASGIKISKRHIQNGMSLSSSKGDISISNINDNGRFAIKFDYNSPQFSANKGTLLLNFGIVELEGIGAGKAFLRREGGKDIVVFEIISNGSIIIFKQ